MSLSTVNDHWQCSTKMVMQSQPSKEAGDRPNVQLQYAFHWQDLVHRLLAMSSGHASEDRSLKSGSCLPCAWQHPNARSMTLHCEDEKHTKVVGLTLCK